MNASMSLTKMHCVESIDRQVKDITSMCIWSSPSFYQFHKV